MRNRIFVGKDVPNTVEYSGEYVTEVIRTFLLKYKKASLDDIVKMLGEKYSGRKFTISSIRYITEKCFFTKKGIIYLDEETYHSCADQYEYKLFFKNSDIDDNHSCQTVLNYLNSTLFSSKKYVDIDEIKNAIITKYPLDKINYDNLKRMCNYYYGQYNRGTYFLRDDINIEKSNAAESEVEKQVISLSHQPFEELYDLLNNNLKSNTPDVSAALKELYTIEIKNNQRTITEIYSIYNNIIGNETMYIEKIHKYINELSPKYTKININQIFSNEFIQSYFALLEIYKISDLTKVNAETILVYASSDINSFLYILEQLSGTIEQYYSKKIEEYISFCCGDRFEILADREGFIDGCPKTLAEVGELNNVTRERIRQIESKVTLHLKKNIHEVQNSIELICNIYVSNSNISYITIDELAEYINNLIVAREISFLIGLTDSPYQYSSQLNLIYDSRKTNEENIVKDILNKFGYFVTIKDFQSASNFEKHIISSYYRILSSHKNMYIQNGILQSDIAAMIISSSFPNGYHVYDENDYNKFIQIMYSSYPFDIDSIPSMNTIHALTARSIFCLVDKGTYKARKDCIELPDQLYNDMISFIISQMPMVDYITIYSKFEEELKGIGVNNRFYLKGLIDPLLPDFLKNQRDYITSESNQISAYDSRLQFMKSFNGEFTLNDLRKKYQGVADYVFLLQIHDQFKNGLINIDHSRYIYITNLHLDQNTIEILRQIIEQLFVSTEAKAITSAKIYAKLCLFHKDVKQKYPELNNSYGLFSVIQFIFKNDYYFSRPYVSKTNDKELTTFGVIYDHLSKFDEFDYSTLNDFCMKMNIRLNFSFNRVVDMFSDDYVQVEQFKVVSKDKIPMTADIHKKLQQSFNLIFEDSKEITTEHFTGYMLFPNLKYRWNKFLLAGVIRTYFSDQYTITPISTSKFLSIDNYKFERIEND